MKDYIIISRAGYKLGRIITKEYNEWSRRNYKKVLETDTAQAAIISPRLAAYKIPKNSPKDEQWYHIIHIPTGLVIAFVHHYDVGMTKKTFESFQWTLHDGNTFRVYNQSFTFEIHSTLRYDIVQGN